MRAVGLVVSVCALAVSDVGARAQTTYPSPYPQGTNPYLAVPSPYTVQPLSDADQLASEIRLLAADPHNLQALVRAGELALKLDDDTAAAAFFARAERIDPRNARVKAGEGSLLVSAERPGDALRHFAEAEALGGDARSFSADRGLAFDLIGEQDRAQRDYRLALRAGSNDETQRRYALSLGISGKRELALKQIDPLLRKSDRGAWRSRAFILAMSGDKAGAEKIATSMMPAGMAQGLQPFFEILPSLRAADRAFAVHFGEVRATPERMADARMVPAFAALGPDPTAPVEVAVVPQTIVATDPREQRRKARKARQDRRQVAAVTTPPPQPLPAPPPYSGQALAATSTAPSSIRVAPATLPTTVAPATVQPRPPVVVAALPERRPLIVPSAPITQRVVPIVPQQAPGAAPAVSKSVIATPGVSAPALTKPPVVLASTVSTPAVATRVPVVAGPPTSLSIATTAPVVPSAPLPATNPLAAPPPAEVNPVVTAAASPVLSAAPETMPSLTAAAPRSAPTPVRSEESILASIIADIKVPGSELAVVPPPAEPERAVVARVAPGPTVDQALVDKKAADRKAAADKKALADKKAAADKKLADKKAAEEKRRNDPRILEPSRIWVQVAGGANEGTLPKAWSAVRAKSKAFGSKGGWTTPLRATNRILTGPFKSDDEAQNFVNSIAKDGISGFVFVSDAGQKITKLAAK